VPSCGGSASHPFTRFDVWQPAPPGRPPSLAFVFVARLISPTKRSSSFRFLYLLKRALRVALPQQQQGSVEILMEGFAAVPASVWPLPDPSRCSSGEFASLRAILSYGAAEGCLLRTWASATTRQPSAPPLRLYFARRETGLRRSEAKPTFRQSLTRGSPHST